MGTAVVMYHSLIEQLPSIAAEYMAATPSPYSLVWKRFNQFTLEQFRKLVADGWNFDRDNYQYETSADMFQDMKGKHLIVFNGGKLKANHPLRYTTYQSGVFGDWTYNEMFRAVHDVNGHSPTQAPFESVSGEIEAYLTHKRFYPLECWDILFSETIGQLAYHTVTGHFVPEQSAVIIRARF